MPAHRLHHCGDEGFGIGDLIGLEPLGEVEIELHPRSIHNLGGPA